MLYSHTPSPGSPLFGCRAATELVVKADCNHVPSHLNILEEHLLSQLLTFVCCSVFSGKLYISGHVGGGGNSVGEYTEDPNIKESIRSATWYTRIFVKRNFLMSFITSMSFIENDKMPNFVNDKMMAFNIKDLIV